jgi:hypothetical protein
MSIFRPSTYDEALAKETSAKTQLTMEGYWKGMLAKAPRGPSRDLLVSLVAKLNRVTAEPARLTLTKEQRQQVLTQLQGLSVKHVLTEEEAKKRLDSLLDILKDHKETLVSVDFPWPGSQRSANPFLQEDNRAQLNALQAALEKR